MTAQEIKKFSWLIKFESDTCTVCKMIQPIIDQIRTRFNVDFRRLDANEEQLARDLEIYSVPYLVVYKNWEIVSTHTWPIDESGLCWMLWECFEEDTRFDELF